ncbi:MAG: hypothetical protein FJ148_19530 [Deltaproteobacteria bacterium]|nr:hypothetical protein [Deltaproteobacteria bacterium]
MRFDIELAKSLGCNMIRKHVKVEPQRWYAWTDRLGILVWQDMPNTGIYVPVSDAAKTQFELELERMIDGLRSHPSIVVWVPFNTGWGQYDVERVAAAVKQLDPARLVSANSGSANGCQAIDAPATSDLVDAHLYAGPYAPPPDHRASVSTEFGTCEGATPGHTWFPTAPDGDAPSAEANAGLLRQQWDALHEQMRAPGLSAAAYVELYDIEQELSGIQTYDRRVAKCDAALARELNGSSIAASRDRAGIALRTPADAPADVPLGSWSFDEGTGEVAHDASPSGNDLALSGAIWAPDGASGGALRFAGDGEAATSGSVLDGASSFSVVARLRHDDRRQTASAVTLLGERRAGLQMGLRASDERPDLSPA